MFEFLTYFFITIGCSLLMFLIFAFLLLKVPQFKVSAAYDVESKESFLKEGWEIDSDEESEWCSGDYTGVIDECTRESRFSKELEVSRLGVTRRRVSSSTEDEEEIKDLNRKRGGRDQKIRLPEWQDSFFDNASLEQTDARKCKDLNDSPSSKDLLR
ncbi:hypothetical protein RUND412_002572 [Rhizina undulata]